MAQQNSLRLKLLTYGVIVYMCLAFSWWSILLYTKNRDAYHAKVDSLRLVMLTEGTYGNESEFRSSEAFQNLDRRYSRQEWMILGEAGFFMVSIILGVWIISRSYTNLINTAEEKRNFLLSITHELKSPIASARLGLETIQKRPLNKEQVDKIANNSQFELDRLKSLVDNLLLAAKVESNYRAVFERENINKLIREQVERIQMVHPDVEFRMRLSEKAKMADMDRAGLQSILTNLLENAIKYSPEEKIIEVDTERKEDSICIRIKDQGVGLPEDEKSKVFKKFYRIGSEDTRKTKGTGLGLYIVKQLVNIHGGTISITDNSPKGTIFSVSIPRQQN
jgi:signal transduction histidine kinase